MTIRLGRVAACLALAFASARCADKINPPVANPGAAITVNTGSFVALDGRSSSDPQGRPLAYEWGFTQRPAPSRASFNDAQSATPSFTPDVDGDYAVELVVSNGVLSSKPAQVMVTARKCSLAAPEVTSVSASPANPNTGTSVALSAVVHDADNDAACNLGQTFTLQWTVLSRPGGSTKTLSDPAANSPTIIPDAVGDYQFSVVATDSTGLKSEPKFLTFKTTTCGHASPTITSATASSATPNPGDTVTLTVVADDADNAAGCVAGQALRFDWRVVAQPAGSSATVADLSTTTPTTTTTITPDAAGTYQLAVTATDSTGNVSNTKFVTFTATACGSASPVIASATAAPATPNIGTAVQLAATGTDADNSTTCHRGETLSFRWSMVSRPASSSATLSDLASDSPSFTPDAVGTYQFSVTASDGHGHTSPPTFVPVTTTACGTHAPTVAIGSTPASPTAGTAIQLTSTVADADNAGTCNLGETFTFAWSLTRPSGSVTAFLSDPAASSPSFTPDVAGTYRATLTVTDSRGFSSQVAVRDIVVASCGAAAVTFATQSFTTSFTDPDDAAGTPPHTTGHPNVDSVVTLTAQATDPGVACGAASGAGAVQFQWTLAGPSGSTAVAFTSQAGAQFTFTPDVAGTYDVSVRAVDGRFSSASASTSVSTTGCGSDPIDVDHVTAAFTTVNSFTPDTVTATAKPTTCPARFAPQFAWSLAGTGAPAQLDKSFGNPIHFQGTGAGNFVVSAVAINATGHAGNPASASITVDACGSRPPVVTSVNNSPAFPARFQTVSLTATAADPDDACGEGRASTIAFELLSAPQASGFIFPPGSTSFSADVEGKYSFRVVATESGTGLRSDAAILNVTVLDPDPAASSLVALATSGAAFVVADNVDSATVTATIRNRLGQPIAALPVSLAVSGGANTFHPSANGSTDANGVFSATLTSTKAELKTFTGTARPARAPVVLNDRPSVNFVAGPTASIVLSGLPPTVTAGDRSTVTVTAFDAFGNVAKGPNAYTGTIHFTSTDTGTGAFVPANFTFSSANDGTHSFVDGVRLVTAGLQTVTVTDTVTPTFTSSQSTTVAPAAPAVAAFTVQPSTTTAGEHITPAVRVTVKDAFTNLVPAASVTLAIGNNAGGGTLSGTKTASTNASGVASFADLSIEKTGVGYTLLATVPSTPADVTQESTAFDITAAAPATAAFTVQPTTTVAGEHITPAVKVTVKDRFLNLVLGASVTLTIKTNPGGGTLSGTIPQSTNASGVATFADLSIDKTGVGYTLLATVPSTPADVTQESTAFDITPAAPATAAFTVQPTTTTAGVHITPAVEVTVKDRFFNLIPGASVTVAIGNNAGGGTLSGTTIRSTNSSGVASFADLSIDKTGVAYTLVATVPSTPTDVTQTSTAFDITAAAPATATFTVQPTTTTTGLPITPAVQVTVKDAFTNLVPGASVTMSLGIIATPSAVLSGTLLQTTNASGIAAFANLNIDKAGVGYTLKATVASTPANIVQESNLFNVVVPPTITSFTAQPANIFTGGLSQLTFVFANGTASIDPGGATFATSGTTVVTVADSTTFTLKVTNAAGTQATANATVNVPAPTGWVDLNNDGTTPPNTKTAEPFSFAFDPTDPSTIFAATQTDGVLMTSTGGPPWIETGFPVTTARGVSVARPGGALSVWVTIDDAGRLYHSTDGATWEEVTGRNLPAPAPIARTTIRLDPSDPLQKTLYVTFSEGGLFRSTDDGLTWAQVPLPLTTTTFDDQATALAIAPDGTVYVGTASGNLFRVLGDTVALLTTADPGSQVNAIALSADGNTVIAGHSDGVVEFGTAPDFTFATGATPLGGAVAALTFAVDGFSSAGTITGTTYAVTATGTPSGGAIFRSTDLGATFKDVTDASTPIDTSDYFFIAPHPNDGTTLYVAGKSSGFFKRTFDAPSP